MHTIAILNLKGGTGKSTTTRNMAYLLAMHYGKRVLVGDLDSSGNLSAMFGMRPDACQMCPMGEVMENKDSDPHDFILKTSLEGLDLLAANDTLKPVDTAIRLDQRTPQQTRLKKQLAKVSSDYDYVLLDCPPSEDLLVINALACAQEVIIPCEVSMDSMDAAIRVSKLVMEIEDFNPSLTIRGMLMTMVQNNALDKDGINLEIPGIPKFKTYIRQSVEVKRSRFLNASLHEYVKKEKKKPFTALFDYDNFVAEYMGEAPVHTDVPYLREVASAF